MANQIDFARFSEGQVIEFEYTNWRGESSRRRAKVQKLVFGSTEWHQAPQWLIEAEDLEKNAVRLFALSDIKLITL